MDFTDLPERTASGEHAVLFDLDLATGDVLWTRPCRRKDAALVAKALAARIARHGAPPLIRIGNGKALHAGPVRAVLEPLGVALRRTPNRTPGYNGSCESGLGWHERRITDVAERDGGIGAWTTKPFETMRVRANDARRPWGWREPPIRRPIQNPAAHSTASSVRQSPVEEVLCRMRSSLFLASAAVIGFVAAVCSCGDGRGSSDRNVAATIALASIEESLTEESYDELMREWEGRTVSVVGCPISMGTSKDALSFLLVPCDELDHDGEVVAPTPKWPHSLVVKLRSPWNRLRMGKQIRVTGVFALGTVGDGTSVWAWASIMDARMQEAP